MQDSKPAAALIQSSVKDDLLETLAMAEAMNFVAAPKTKVITSMIQGKASVDPSDPDYKYHSNDIIDLLKKLDVDFKSQKKTVDDEYAKSKTACDQLKASLKKEMGSNSDAMQALDKSIAKLGKEIAEDRGNLVQSEADMKDDEQYLKDLTARCEDRAHDWDQRSSMRNNEIEAITQALTVLTGDVKSKADEVNKRALLQAYRKAEAASVPVKKPAAAQQACPSSIWQTIEAYQKRHKARLFDSRLPGRPLS
jgi:chromosome segregation ATPase